MTETAAHPTVIEIRNLVKQYDQKLALSGVSFDVRAGEILGLLGPNGAGKSTTMKILTSYIAATSGEVKVDGLALQDHAVAVRAMLGYLPESTPLYNDMVVYDYLIYVAEMRGFDAATSKRRVAEVAATVGIRDVVGMAIGTLSKGYKQRVGLAQALLHNPKILILDEPTSGLDPNQIVEIRNLIRELGKNHTVILSSHNLSEVRQICDRIVIIHRGAVVADGTVDELEGKVASTHRLIVALSLGTGAQTEQVRSALAGLPGVRGAVLSHHSTLPVQADTFEVEATTDLRPEIARWAQGAGHGLVELRRKSVDLETIFQQLTHDA